MPLLALAVAVAFAAAPGAKATKKTPPRPIEEAKSPPVRQQPPPPPIEQPKVAQATEPAAVDAAAQPTSSAGFKLLNVGGITGATFFFSGGPMVLRVGAQAEARLLPLGDALTLELEAPLVMGFARQTVSFAGLFEFTSAIFMLELAPSIQAVRTVGRGFELYGGFGLGPVLASTTTAVQFEGPQTSNSFGVVIRLTSGARVKVNDKVSIFVEPVSLHVYAMGGATIEVAGQTVQTSGSTGVAYLFSLGASYSL